MAKSVYLGQNISRAPKEKSAWTSPATVLTGDTTVTIYDSRIKSSSIIKKYVEPFSDGEVLGASNIQITDGQAVITFDSPAKEDTTIKLEIIDGEGFKEVTLWENSAPTSDFDGQTVTLSDNISNYNYLVVKFKASKSMADSNAVRTIIPVSDLENMAITASTPDIRISGTESSGSTGYSRYVIKASDTSITFGKAYATNTVANVNGMAIPLKITGLTELNQVKIRNAKIENVLWTNPSPSSNFGGQTITLSEDMNNYDYLGISWAYSTSNQSGNGINKLIMSVPDFKKVAYTSTAGTYPAVGTFTGAYSYARGLIRSSDTTIYVGNCYQTSTSTQANGTNIPLQIIGIKEVSTHKADIYGAAQDTIYYSTNGTDWTVVGQTDSNGYLANAVLPDTAFILKSSVAKNPEDLTADYTKAFNTDSNVLKFMPDGNVLYWYGYKSDNLEVLSTANGWTPSSGYTFVDPTFNTNYIDVNGSASKHAGVASKTVVSKGSFYVIAKGITASSNTYGNYTSYLAKNISGSYDFTSTYDSASDKKYVGTITNDNEYIVSAVSNARRHYLYALWYE